MADPWKPIGAEESVSPSVAPRQGRTQRVVAGYVADIHAAHADCEGKLWAVRGLVEGAR